MSFRQVCVVLLKGFIDMGLAINIYQKNTD